MAVVSFSLPDELVTEMDRLITAQGLKGRSAFARGAIRQALGTTMQAQTTGHVHGSVTLSYKHGHEARISELRHHYHDVVLSMMHTHCEPTECMDVLLVGGDAKRVQQLHAELQTLPIVGKASLAIIHTSV